jgi:CelD/BcsL family acetyltransferase involved in cellulose biosynthesis
MHSADAPDGPCADAPSGHRADPPPRRGAGTRSGCCTGAPSGLAVFDGLAQLPADALALFERAPDRDLFCGIAWYETVLACCVAADAAPRFVVCGGAGRALALLPMQIQAGGRHLASLTTVYTCRYQPLCDPDADAAALTAAFVAFARYCRALPTVRLDALDADAPWLPALLTAAASAGLASRQFAHFGNWQERVAGLDWARYLAARQGQLRETIRRRLARAGRDGGRFQLVTGGDALEAGIAAYQSVYARSWKPAEPFPHFNAALMRATAARGLLRLGLYWRDDQPVAAQFWIVEDAQATVLKLAHDEAAKSLSAGTVLTALMLQHLLDQEHVGRIDFGRGDDAYKRLWASERRQRIGIVLANPRRPRGLAFLARHALGRVRQALTL